jgi:hypothetical protein
VNYWKVILATVVIFGAGVVTGGLLVHLARMPVPPPKAPASGRPAEPASAGAGTRLEFLRRAQRELELTADQRDRLSKILHESQERTKQIMEPVTPQIREELRRTRAEFVEALTPAQRIRFNELARQQQQQQQHTRELRNSASREAPAQPAPKQQIGVDK